jgi:hypothetical protein
MRTISLTQGREALVSDEDYEWASQWAWYFHHGRAERYTRTTGGIYLHREVAIQRMELILHSDEVDHRDRNQLNNQRYNLRIATRSQQNQNRRVFHSNSIGLKGVAFHSQSQRWHARIRYRKNLISLGLFESAEEAARAYDRAARIYFGEFAVLNFPERDER